MLLCQGPSHLPSRILTCDQTAQLRQAHEEQLPRGHAQEYREEQQAACSGTHGAMQPYVHIRANLSLRSSIRPLLPPRPPNRCGALAEEGQPLPTVLPCRVHLACGSDLFLITHLSLSDRCQLLRKTPGCSPVPGRMVTRQSFWGLRAGGGSAD